MTDNASADNAETLKRALRSLFEEYRGTNSDFMRHFSLNFVQWANGRTSNLTDLISHFDKMEETRPNRTIRFIDVVAAGDVVFDQHVVTATVPEGDDLVVDVFAKWTFKDGQIMRCDELTRHRESANDGATK